MNAIRTGSKQLLLTAGWYASRLRHDTFPGVAVFCYHAVRADAAQDGALPFEGLHVRASELDAHCRLVREYCDPISLDGWRAAAAGRVAWPSRPVLFTFDDGYRSVQTIARPILERHHIPAVVFACTAPSAARTALWFDAVARQDGEAAVERAKTLRGPEWRAIVERFAGAVPDDSALATLTRDELRGLANHELFEVGAHTANHPVLASLTPAEQRDEIQASRDELAAWTGRPVRAFAYPNGRPRIDYTADTIAIVQSLGFDAAFTTAPRFAVPGEPALEHSRFMLTSGLPAAEIAHRLAHSWPR